MKHFTPEFDGLKILARREGRIMYLVGCGSRREIVPADEYKLGYGDKIYYVAYPPEWVYRARREPDAASR